MNNRKLYKAAFSGLHASRRSLEEIMEAKKRPARASKRTVITVAVLVIMIIGTLTVNAISGGKVFEFFNGKVGESTVITGGEYNIPVDLNSMNIGIYNAENELVESLNQADADSIDMDYSAQTCTIDGKTYSMMVIMVIDEDANDQAATEAQIRLYAPEDYEEAMSNFDPDACEEFKGKEIAMPHVQLD